MESDWDFYFCELNGHPASVLVDLAYGESGPVDGLSDCVTIRIPLRQPRSDGLPTREEFPRLNELEDALEGICAQHEGTLRHVGRVTTNGIREFYFYSSEGTNAASEFSQVFGAFPDYVPEIEVEPDAEWALYFQLLFPSDREMQMILNERILRQLESVGDQPQVERDVVHWMYFPTEQSRQEFMEQVSQWGFQASAEPPSEESQLPFGVVVSRHQTADRFTIHETVLMLYDLTDRHGGIYDGWETAVVKADDNL
jgi:uncharacterized protein (TIGR01619 family)